MLIGVYIYAGFCLVGLACFAFAIVTAEEDPNEQ